MFDNDYSFFKFFVLVFIVLYSVFMLGLLVVEVIGGVDIDCWCDWLFDNGFLVVNSFRGFLLVL